MARTGSAQDRYVEIAAARFAERGFDGVSLSALAEDAAVTRQALLHFFSTKERLYAEVLAQLAKRLSSEIDRIDADSAEDRLIACFDALATRALAQPDDARLVIRALLESDASARVWPLKAYLDKLVTLTLETRHWQGSRREDALAALYQLIGAIQYFAISGAALRGMFGADTLAAMSRTYRRNIDAAIRSFVGRR